MTIIKPIVFSIAVTIIVASCSLFDIEPEEHFDEYACAILPLNDGGVYLTGSSRGCGNTELAFIARLSSIGDVIWKQQLSYPKNSRGVAIQESSGGDVVLILTEVDEAQNGLCAVKIDSTGGEIWTRVIGTDLNIRPIDVSTYDNGFMLTGSTNSADGGVPLLVIDLDGCVVFEREYGRSLHGKAVTKVQTGGFLLWSQSSTSHQDSTFLIRVSESGDSLWATHSIGLISEAKTMKQDIEGNILIAGTSPNYRAILIRLSPSGEMMSAYEYPYRDITDAIDLVEASDGGVVLSCQQQWYHSSHPAPYLIIKVRYGIREWEYECSNPGVNEPPSIASSAGNDFFVAGSKRIDRHNETDLDIYLVRSTDTGEEIWERTFEISD